MKFMDLDEFTDVGYLQELNRRFLHPLGLALVIEWDTDETDEAIPGSGRLKGIWDARDDLEGINFADGVLDPEKHDRLEQAWTDRHGPRVAALHYMVQPFNDPRLADQDAPVAMDEEDEE